MSAYRELEGRFKRLSELSEAEAVLHWDSAVMMPSGGAEARAGQIAALQVLRHEAMAAPKLAALLDEAEAETIYASYLDSYYGSFLTEATPLDGAHSLLAHLGWSDRFPVVVGRETATAMKPAPEPALYALAKLGLPPDAAAFAGDTGEDMRCARSAGIPIAVGLTVIRSAEQLREAGATHTVASLEAMATPLLGTRA